MKSKTDKPDNNMSTPKPKKKGIPLLSNLLGSERRRHQVAMITEEGEWNQHESNSGMARVFVVMLLVHVVLIGSIIVYDFVGTDESAAAPTPTVAKALTPEARELPAQPLPEAIIDAPETAAPAPAADATPTPELAVALEIYEVKTGDSLPKIAAAKGVSLEDLIALNHLDEGNTEITAFTRLKIPSNKVAPPARVEPIKDFPVAQTNVPSASPVIPLEETPPAPLVAAEDALPSVVPLANTTIDSTPPAPSPAAPASESTPPAPALVPVVNAPTPVAPQKPSPVAPPSSVVSKPTAKPEAPKPVVKPTVKPSGSSKSHTMGKGDTLYSLSRKFGVSVTAIQKANNITNPNAIREGTKLVIPAK
jgi:LysM repeat protein